jgi:hypothetical protein
MTRSVQLAPSTPTEVEVTFVPTGDQIRRITVDR